MILGLASVGRQEWWMVWLTWRPLMDH